MIHYTFLFVICFLWFFFFFFNLGLLFGTFGLKLQQLSVFVLLFLFLRASNDVLRYGLECVAMFLDFFFFFG